jgi:hypothetical protein
MFMLELFSKFFLGVWCLGDVHKMDMGILGS